MSITLEESIDELRKSFIDWDRFQVTHTKKLYKMLAEARRILVQIQANQSQVEFELAFKARGGKSAKNTTLELKVVKVAMTDDSKRASAYSRVLKVAAKENIAPEDISAWIENKGGIEKIRLENSDPHDPNSKINSAKMSLFSRQVLLEKVNVPNLEAKKNDVVILIGRAGEDDTIDVFEIAYSGSDDALVNAAVAAVGKKNADNSASQEEDQDEDRIVELLAESAHSAISKGGTANV